MLKEGKINTDDRRLLLIVLGIGRGLVASPATGPCSCLVDHGGDVESKRRPADYKIKASVVPTRRRKQMYGRQVVDVCRALDGDRI